MARWTFDIFHIFNEKNRRGSSTEQFSNDSISIREAAPSNKPQPELFQPQLQAWSPANLSQSRLPTIYKTNDSNKCTLLLLLFAQKIQKPLGTILNRELLHQMYRTRYTLIDFKYMEQQNGRQRNKQKYLEKMKDKEKSQKQQQRYICNYLSPR